MVGTIFELAAVVIDDLGNSRDLRHKPLSQRYMSYNLSHVYDVSCYQGDMLRKRALRLMPITAPASGKAHWLRRSHVKVGGKTAKEHFPVIVRFSSADFAAHSTDLTSLARIANIWREGY